MERRNLKMDNDNVLDMRHLIRVADDENKELSEDWKDYSESTSTSLAQAMEENYLTGQQKRRLRRKMERKLKKIK